MEYRALEGFVFAVTPFNFTAIAGNLCAAPALMGNTIVWKPASQAVLSGYYLMKILKEAGLPDGVINFIPGNGSRIGEGVLHHPALAGINFTGSTQVFRTLWKKVGEHIDTYVSYSRIVGETGGKDYIFMHASAHVDQVVTAAIRGAFEYQGQKSQSVKMDIGQNHQGKFCSAGKLPLSIYGIRGLFCIQQWPFGHRLRGSDRPQTLRVWFPAAGEKGFGRYPGHGHTDSQIRIPPGG